MEAVKRVDKVVAEAAEAEQSRVTMMGAAARTVRGRKTSFWSHCSAWGCWGAPESGSMSQLSSAWAVAVFAPHVSHFELTCNDVPSWEPQSLTPKEFQWLRCDSARLCPSRSKRVTGMLACASFSHTSYICSLGAAVRTGRRSALCRHSGSSAWAPGPRGPLLVDGESLRKEIQGRPLGHQTPAVFT